ncbi:MAG: GAF domain-containing protein [Chloroflexota bacterium]|nr:GAF domain-containing protein [Chloroflexota bacterium]
MDDQILETLIRLVTEHGPSALWAGALQWIAETYGARGGQVLVDLQNPERHETGYLDEAAQEAIKKWESKLLDVVDWMPSGRGSLRSLPPIASSETHPVLPLCHVPIRQGHELVGGLSLFFPPESLCSLSKLRSINALVQTISRLSLLASERYQMQRRLTQLNVLNEVSLAISSSLDMDAILEGTTALAVNALGATSSSMLLFDNETQELEIAYSYGENTDRLQQLRVPVTEGVAGWVARNGQPAIVNNVREDGRFSPRVDGSSGQVTRNIICVPLMVKGQALGVLEVLNKEDDEDFSAEDLDWLTLLAAQASIALDNARLYISLREERDRILRTEEDVRHRLARNLHDSAAQIMSALIMNLEVTRRLAISGDKNLEEEFDYLRDLAQQANNQIRHSLFELRPLILESKGLLAVLQSHVQRQRQRGHDINLTSEPLPTFTNRDNEAIVYLIMMGALSNIMRHANASQIWLRLWVREPMLIVEIEDNGGGFDTGTTDRTHRDRGKFGLLNMRERAEKIQAVLTITSPRPGQENGTMVLLAVPLEELS